MTQLSDPERAHDIGSTWEEAQKGDPSAWEALFRECYPKVRRVVRRKFNRSMRSLYDSTDFANDAMERLAANIDLLAVPFVRFALRISRPGGRTEGHRRVPAAAHPEARHHARTADARPMMQGRFRSLRTTRPPVSLPQANECHERLLARDDETERDDHRAEAAGYTDGGHRRKDRLEYPQGAAVPQRAPGFDG